MSISAKYTQALNYLQGMTWSWLPGCLLVLHQVATSGMHFLNTVALAKGVDKTAFFFFRELVSVFILLPLSLIFERDRYNMVFTIHSISWMFLNTILSVFLDQAFYIAGSLNTSGTVAAALTCLGPGLALIASRLFRIETHLTTSWYGRLKIISTVGVILGTLMMVFGKHQVVFVSGLYLQHDLTYSWNIEKNINTKAFGVVLLTCSFIFQTCWFILQVNAPFTTTGIMSAISAVMVACFAAFWKVLTGNPPASSWRIHEPMVIGAIVYNGVVMSALSFVLTSWCLRHRTPLFVFIFSPISIIVDGIVNWLLFEPLYLGRILGAVLIMVSLIAFGYARKNDTEANQDGTDRDTMVIPNPEPGD